MQFRAPTEWFEDLNVHIDDEKLIAEASRLEATVLHGASRIGAAAWTILVSAIAGAFGGFTVSGHVRSSWLIFLSYLVAGAVLLRTLKPLSARLLGPAVAWQAVFSFFWACLLAMLAVMAGRIDTVWLFYTVSIGGGLFIGLMYGSLTPGFTTNQDAGMMTALPLGALSAWSAASLQRALDASGNPPWSEAYVGVMASTVFMVPMAALLALLSSRSNGLAKMATLYLHNENFTAKALEYLDQAIALSPRSAHLYNLRGIARSKLGDGDGAEADYRKVTVLAPRAAEAHMNRGVDLLRQGNIDGAIDALKQATTVNPKLATAFSNLGTAYQKKGDLDAAIDSYTRAITLREKYPIAFANRAYAYYLKGAYDLAISDANRSVKLDPRLPMAHTNLGHALVGKGDVLMAARSYRRALALGPDRTVEAETLEALEKLGVRAEDEEQGEDE